MVQPPQCWVWPGEQDPWLRQLPQLPQLQLELQYRYWVPQLPQDWLWDCPGEHTPWP